MAQALLEFLAVQWVRRDGREMPFFAGLWGIFGHGNVAGIGQAVQQMKGRLPYYLSRNEQAQVHAAVAYTKHKNRLQTWACTSSIGPGATNMVTGAALATINRLPVLLLPGDIFAHRYPAPVLQQLECPQSLDVSVNDCFRPVSRFWDRINRPDQLAASLMEAMRVLTSPAETGAVTLCLPQDVQTEAFDYPDYLFEKRSWTIPRQRADASQLQEAARWIRASKKPLIVAGGGVHYSEAHQVLQALVEQTGIPVAETQAGKGSLLYDHPLNLGALGATGTHGANRVAREADLVLGVGTRYSDFTTASNTAFQNPEVRFINLNVAEVDAYKLRGLPLQGDARATLEELAQHLLDFQVSAHHRDQAQNYNLEWDAEVARIYQSGGQGEVIGVLNEFIRPQDVVICAAGSLPGDLHKLWRTRDHRAYHLEYGYSCMGYEVAAGMGVKQADPEREVYVMVGDGSFLMMHTEIVTMVAEGIKVNILVLDNQGYASIGGLSKGLGSDGFGTKYRKRTSDGLTGEPVEIDFAANCASLGAEVFSPKDSEELKAALQSARDVQDKPVCICLKVDRRHRVGGYESWWDVPVAEVSEDPEVRAARQRYEEAREARRP
ncbi:MAG: 3D-(3,5/4)-trihydroxycyclohexane-1,2-dione acylhydrolase (decyclizing) [Candidatus Eremiobacteraeota bacterium]|nr:3D-(3,5/4)-trihydroxycyclohexane-1,2-dione acylhydrolase (decyclizing) [Candidatus Eremiobacteraeota bacterium]